MDFLPIKFQLVDIAQFASRAATEWTSTGLDRSRAWAPSDSAAIKQISNCRIFTLNTSSLDARLVRHQREAFAGDAISHVDFDNRDGGLMDQKELESNPVGDSKSRENVPVPLNASDFSFVGGGDIGPGVIVMPK
jgi:hypothetical protein